MRLVERTILCRACNCIEKQDVMPPHAKLYSIAFTRPTLPAFVVRASKSAFEVAGGEGCQEWPVEAADTTAS